MIPSEIDVCFVCVVQELRTLVCQCRHLAQSFFQLFLCICLFDVGFSDHFVGFLKRKHTHTHINIFGNRLHSL